MATEFSFTGDDDSPRLVVHCSSLYRSSRYEGAHAPFRHSVEIANKEVNVIGIQRNVLYVRIDNGEAHPVENFSTGLNGTVVTVDYRDERGDEYHIYTDILTEEGKKRGGIDFKSAGRG